MALVTDIRAEEQPSMSETTPAANVFVCPRCGYREHMPPGQTAFADVQQLTDIFDPDYVALDTKIDDMMADGPDREFIDDIRLVPMGRGVIVTIIYHSHCRYYFEADD